MTTTELARKAIDRLALAQRVEFNPPDSANPLAIAWSLVSGGRAGNPQDRLVDAFLARLTVFPIAKSRVLQIEFSSADPALAAKGANAVAELYLDSQEQAKRDTAKAAGAWLATKIDELRGKVAEAESKVEAFRASSGLFAGANGMTAPTQQLADLTTQLATVRANHANALARAQALREMLRDGRLDEIPQVARDDSLRRYVEQRVALKAQIALESRTLLPEHPRMKELAGELAGLDAEIRIAADKAVAGLQSDAKTAAVDVDNLSATLDRQSKTVASGNADDVQLRALELDAKTARDQLESYSAEVSGSRCARGRQRRSRRRAHHRQRRRAAHPNLSQEIPDDRAGDSRRLVRLGGCGRRPRLVDRRDRCGGEPVARQGPTRAQPAGAGGDRADRAAAARGGGDSRAAAGGEEGRRAAGV